MEVSADPQLADLAMNDHACLTFGDAEELLDLTAAFIRDGLASGLKVLWVGGAAGQLEFVLAERGLAVKSAVESGQISAVGVEGHVLSDQAAFESARAIRWLTRQIDASRAQGFAGLGVALDMSWALRPISGVEQLPDFEDRVAAATTDARATILCAYDRERFDPVTLASVTPMHTRSVAAATYHADAILRICRQYAPPGIRIAGEIDYRAEEPLTLALAEALRIDTDITTVNMADLRFIDATCARMILNAAGSLGGTRKMILRCPPSVARWLTVFGAGDVPGVSVVTVHER
ncbi:MAG TPA: MEDS domain-containing protein [Streptosporangiaceae bacterium]|nr:MEDS domain-containing protein [Streptosporangiaceae bacterium]